jgi:hypothetical protein
MDDCAIHDSIIPSAPASDLGMRLAPMPSHHAITSCQCHNAIMPSCQCHHAIMPHAICPVTEKKVNLSQRQTLAKVMFDYPSFSSSRMDFLDNNRCHACKFPNMDLPDPTANR